MQWYFKCIFSGGNILLPLRGYRGTIVCQWDTCSSSAFRAARALWIVAARA
jgi:hypothetical protein